MNRLLAALAQVELPGLDQEGPDELRAQLTVFFVLLGGGFAIGALGHLVRSRTLTAVGIALIFVGTAFFLVAVGQRG